MKQAQNVSYFHDWWWSYLFLQTQDTNDDSTNKDNSWSLPQFRPKSRNDSYTYAVQDTSWDGTRCCSIRAGLQKTLQLFITNAANVFLLEPSTDSMLLEEQVGY